MEAIATHGPSTAAGSAARAAGTTSGSAARRLVDRLGSSVATARQLAAERFAVIDQLREVAEAETGACWRDPDDLAWRDLRAEVAAVTHVHEKAAQFQLELARRLVHDFTSTLEGMREGVGGHPQNRVVSRRYAHLDYQCCTHPLAW